VDRDTPVSRTPTSINKQAKAERQGYEGNTNNAPTTLHQANNGASQGQTSQAKETTMTEDISHQRAHHSNDTTSPKVKQRGKEHN
jgi:hypothetical protein